MLFNSYEFILVFLPVTFIGYFAIAKTISKLNNDMLGRKCAVFWLTLMSIIFYSWWSYKYVILLMLSISFNYFIGINIERKKSKKWLIFGIVIDVLLLGYYKYTGFFIDNINTFFSMSYEIPNIILPLGISFFTFTQIAYLVDIYRGETANKGFLTYCEFVTIFPHLIAGPIINHKHMMPQFLAKENFKINYDNIAIGSTLFTMGLFKKVVVADSFALLVSNFYSKIDILNSIESWMAIISYDFQIYFDFSGYSEMAIGLGLLFNLRLPVNFNSPYQSCSIIELWRRWHMTLGEWSKNYIYIPLGGGRNGEFAKIRNLFISMVLIGFWHGANWTYVIWGALQGIFLAINHQWRKMNIRLPLILCWGLTAITFVSSSVFFRAENTSDAMNMLNKMFDINELYYIFVTTDIWHEMLNVYIGDIEMLVITAIVVVSIKNPVVLVDKFKPNYYWLIGITLMFLYVITRLNNYSEFLYFQF